MRSLAVGVLLILAALPAWVLPSEAQGQTSTRKPATGTSQPDGLAAWQQVYSVLTHPRCINCHTATNYPQQGDDRHRHFANVVRGPEGTGVPALNCATCHQESNASTGVPGGHNWHLAPLSMAWQDRNDHVLSSAGICAVITDRSKNHNLDGPGLLKHHEDEALVLWAWQPGDRLDGSHPPLGRRWNALPEKVKNGDQPWPRISSV